jgi:hypothetical protein
MTGADEAIDSSPVDHRRQSEAVGNRLGVDPVAQAQTHDQRFVGGLGPG